jgi:hypothetical protein
LAVLGTTILFLVTSVGMTLLWHLIHREVSDITHYNRLAERITHGGMPYRDVGFEYPPGALPPIVLPALISNSHGLYYVTFSLQMALLGIVALALLGRTLEHLGVGERGMQARLALVAAAPIALGGVILTRFDLLPVVVFLGALLALLRGRDRWAFALVGAAIAIKVYPVVVLPVVLVWVMRRSGARAALEGLAIAVAVPAVTFGAFAVLSPGGVGRSIWGQISRPLQVESIGAGVLLSVHQVTDTTLRWASASGSQNLYGTGTGTIAALSSLGGAVALVGLWVSHARGPSSEERLVRYVAASVVAFVAFSKVLSPQYLIWLAFLVPLVAGRRGHWACLLLAGACVATGAWFPWHYWELVKQFDPVSSWLVLVRGVLLLGVLAVLVLRDSRRGSARSPSPVPSTHT